MFAYKFNPNLYIDISSQLTAKINALKAYQYEFRKPPHPRSKEITDAVAKRWGSLSGFKAAEAFEIIFSRMNNLESISLWLKMIERYQSLQTNVLMLKKRYG